MYNPMLVKAPATMVFSSDELTVLHDALIFMFDTEDYSDYELEIINKLFDRFNALPDKE